MYHPLPGHQPHNKLPWILLLPSEHEGRASSPSKKPSVLSCRANHHQCGYVFCLCLIILDLQFNKGTDDWHGLWIDAEKNLKETYGLYQQLREYQGVLYIYMYIPLYSLGPAPWCQFHWALGGSKSVSESWWFLWVVNPYRSPFRGTKLPEDVAGIVWSKTWVI